MATLGFLSVSMLLTPGAPRVAFDGFALARPALARLERARDVLPSAGQLTLGPGAAATLACASCEPADAGAAIERLLGPGARWTAHRGDARLRLFLLLHRRRHSYGKHSH